MTDFSRREFIQESSTLAAGLVAVTQLRQGSATAHGAESEKHRPFTSNWSNCHDRVWLGAEFWSNPLQDWRIHQGRIECVHSAPERNVQLLTRQLGQGTGTLSMRVQMGRTNGRRFGAGRGSAGFRIGIQGPLEEYRNSLWYGTGLNAGLTAAGQLFIGNLPTESSDTIAVDGEQIELRLDAVPDGATYRISLAAYNDSDQLLGKIERGNIPAEHLVGNLGLVCNYGTPRRRQVAAPDGPGLGTFWFENWHIEGSKVDTHDEHAFGPILFSQYTLSDGILKMTAQMPPVGSLDSQTVKLQIPTQPGEQTWKTIATETIHPESRTATFRIEDWDASQDVPYRLIYELTFKSGPPVEHHWTGTVRKDPVNEDVLTVADISCNHHDAFPNQGYVASMAKLNPDFLAFVGDQFYENAGGYGVVRKPLEPAILDYLRKWYFHGWTWRELMRDRPSISLPDDHDVYQGNVWGEAGASQQKTQEMGGYNMFPEWVNVVHRTQTAHHPDPFDPTPIKQNISVYYGSLTYGGVSFAIIADRMFKTGPEGVVPKTKGRGDHVIDPNFDPRTADVPGAELLGERQLHYLRQWAADWRGAQMKALISQTIFTAMATTHGGKRERLRADYDSNGWPQTPRNEALREIRKAFAVHLAGDQHLPAVVHYGVDEHRDAGVAFAGPAVNVGYPRWWEPEEPGKNRKPGAPEITGDFLDHFGNPMTVLAVANGAASPRSSVLEKMQDKASGLGLVRFNKAKRTITIECWPFLADPTTDKQFDGWPITINVLDNYARKAAAYLPTLKISGIDSPVVQVVADDGEVVYTLRLAGPTFQPHVFSTGTYSVRISEPETGRAKELRNLNAETDNRQVIDVDV